MGVKANSSLTTNQMRWDAAKAEAITFKASGNWYASKDAVETLMPGGAELEEWLSRQIPYLAHTTILTKAAELSATTVSAMLLTGTERKNLWDNLFVHFGFGGPAHVKSAIITTLRMDNLLGKLSSASPVTDEVSVWELTRAKLLLPDLDFTSFIVPREASSAEPPADPVKAKLLARGAALANYTKYQTAIADVESFYTEQQRVLATLHGGSTVVNSDGSVTVIPPSDGWEDANAALGEINTENSTDLSTDTRDLLTELGIDLPVPVQTVLAQLRDLSQKASRLTLASFKGYKEVVVSSGGLWLRNDEVLAREGDTPPTPPSGGDTNYEDLYAGFYHRGKECQLRPVSVGDLRIVRHIALGYKAGEITHIENVLIGEKRIQDTRRLLSTEETFSQTIEKIKEEEKDRQSTERNEIQQETTSDIQRQSALHVGLNMSAHWGPVTVNTDMSYDQSGSQSSSSHNARNYAKEVTERASKRIMERTLTERTVRTKREFEEKYNHVFDNVGKETNIQGVYRWVDKFYLNRVFNYGRRLMFELYIPEPAAFHIWANTSQQAEANQEAQNAATLIRKPANPAEGIPYIDPADEDVVLYNHAITAFGDVDEDNYLLWAGAFGIEMEAPPVKFLYKTAQSNHTDNDTFRVQEVGLDMEEGYLPRTLYFNYIQDLDDPNDLYLRVGTRRVLFGPGNGGYYYNDQGREQIGYVDFSQLGGFWTENFQDISQIEGVFGAADKLPISIYGRSDFHLLHLVLKSERSKSLYESWQRMAYQKIYAAYQTRLEAYEAALAAARAALEASQGADMGYGGWGSNPANNREVERTELKRQCIYLLNYGQLPYTDVGWGEAYGPEMTTIDQATNFDFCKAMKNVPYLKFMETVFDWKNLTYTLFPYFWGRKSAWRNLYMLSDGDPDFANFLKAGYARVMLPVEKGYEVQALHFLSTGCPLEGTSPLVNHPLVQQVLKDVQEYNDQLPYITTDGKTLDEREDESIPWVTKLPTSLVVLQPQYIATGNPAEEVNNILPWDERIDPYLPEYL